VGGRPGFRGLIGHSGEGLGFCCEWDSKPLEGVQWENEKVPWLLEVVGNRLWIRDAGRLVPFPLPDSLIMFAHTSSGTQYLAVYRFYCWVT
jgi:hypothetical protein